MPTHRIVPLIEEADFTVQFKDGLRRVPDWQQQHLPKFDGEKYIDMDYDEWVRVTVNPSFVTRAFKGAVADLMHRHFIRA